MGGSSSTPWIALSQSSAAVPLASQLAASSSASRTDRRHQPTVRVRVLAVQHQARSDPCAPALRWRFLSGGGCLFVAAGLGVVTLRKVGRERPRLVPRRAQLSSNFEFLDSMQGRMASPSTEVPAHLNSRELEDVMVSRIASFEDKMMRISRHFSSHPMQIGQRLASITQFLIYVSGAWFLGFADRGDRLRAGVAKLGVVFVKLAQTLATRPDIIGDEAAAALAELQDQNAPFDDALAMNTLCEDLGCVHVAASRQLQAADGKILFATLSDKPVAAASLCQVYKGRTRQGQDVAVKVRRPGVVENIAKDVHCIRVLLKLGKAVGVIAEDTDIAEMTEEVGAGLFREIDFEREAENAHRFAHEHASVLPQLVIPQSLADLTSRRVLTSEWIHGEKLTDLSPDRQELMIREGLNACFTQLLRSGFIHADPHYGNMLFTPDNRLVLLDFGLVSSVIVKQQEAMALAILHTLSRDWKALIIDLRSMGMLPAHPQLWVDRHTGEPVSGLQPGVWRAVTEREFMEAFVTHLDANAGVKNSFSEMTTALSELSLQYRFLLPSCMVFVIRAVITLDGFAAKMDKSISAIEEALPHAVLRALTPKTLEGKRALLSVSLDRNGEPNWDGLSGLLSGTGSSGGCGDQANEAAALAQERERLSRALTQVGDALFTKDGVALRRVLFSLNSPRVSKRALSTLWRIHRELWNRSGEAKANRDAVLFVVRGAALAVRRASGTRILTRSSDATGVGAKPRRQCGRRFRRLLVRRHGALFAQSPMAAVMLAISGILAIALVIEASSLATASRLCRTIRGLRRRCLLSGASGGRGVVVTLAAKSRIDQLTL